MTFDLTAECPLDVYLRESKKSLRQLAKDAGLHASNLSLFRNRKRGLRPASLELLATATGISRRELVLWAAGLPDESAPVPVDPSGEPERPPTPADGTLAAAPSESEVESGDDPLSSPAELAAQHAGSAG